MVPLAGQGLLTSAVAATSAPAPDTLALLAVLALPFLGAALVPVVYRALGERTAYFAAAIALACFALVASQYGRVGAVTIPWIPELGVSLTLYVDGLSLLIGFLASGVGVLILTYSGGYMHGEPGQAKYYASLLAFMGSMLGVAFAADLIALFVFWELTSLSSFMLIGHYQRKRSSQYAARKSMIITVAGGLFMLVGFLLLHHVSAQALGEATYTLVGAETGLIENADAINEALRSSGLLVPVIALIGVGAAAKSAQVPLHIWLPNAMEAPTPVSAFLHSATMVKAGVYLVGRFRPLLVGDEWMLIFAIMGLITMTVAAILAVGATDIKELLAYSTASHLGLIVAGFGFANELGAETGAFHILNHAVFKAALFLVAGIIAHEAGTRLISDLGGLRKDLPIVAAITTVAALSMAGIPPFNGFYSKELLFEAAYEVAAHAGGLWWVFPAVAVLGSVFTFLYSIKFLSLFFGDKPDELGHVHSPPWVMVAPPLLLAGLALVISISPQTAIDTIVQSVFESAIPAHAPGEEVHHMTIGLPTELKPAVIMSAITIGLGAVAWPFYDRLHAGINAVTDVKYLRANWYYDNTVYGLTTVSQLSMPQVQTGLVRTYITWSLAAVSVLALGGYLAAGVALPAFTSVEIGIPTALVLLAAVVGAIAVSTAPSHIAGVLTLSILGFMVAVFFVLSNAPDLALTQLVIETLVLVIFLLVLDKLPAYYGTAKRAIAARDAVLSAVVGVTVFLTVLVTTAATPDDPIYTYFIERAGIPAEHGNLLVEYGGGGNIVNVILVDFRAFDTLGEISVVAMAALSVLTLIAMRGRGERG
ncbi:hydrogen gas-evolving membrane-bound hydrogenase subunit E [Haladaptatus sp. DJG-WS-42]|uniref:hydrogen gas-evolving membrane-bound hydrogenase subunit E n=1 Tax=Haladaptatus sp. DJG-WS-42 TaxID=3120516 RepID=UPI0030D2B83E